jgi:hypothetical protein
MSFSRPQVRTFVVVLGLFAAALVSGCSSDGGSNGTAAGAGQATGCASDTRKDVYTAGLTKTAGALNVKVVEATPAPPAKGTNAMTFELTDAGGKPVDGATITVTPFMPDHAHGSAVTPAVAPAGAGRYSVTNVYLPMAGLWRITFSVQAAGGGATQDAVFQFCLDG